MAAIEEKIKLGVGRGRCYGASWMTKVEAATLAGMLEEAAGASGRVLVGAVQLTAAVIHVEKAQGGVSLRFFVRIDGSGGFLNMKKSQAVDLADLLREAVERGQTGEVGSIEMTDRGVQIRRGSYSSRGEHGRKQ